MTRRSITLEAQHVQALRETVDRLRLEIEELRTSRERLVLAADADRRSIERDLHDGVQQHLVVLAVNLELARQAEGDSSAIKELLAEMKRGVQQALDEAAQLAERVYPPLLEAGGLAAALRSAVVAGGRAASVEVTATASYPPAVAGAVYFCCVEALEHMGSSERAKLTVRDEEGALAFEVEGEASSTAVTASADGFEQLRDRAEAFGGRLVIRRAPTGGICVSGSIPLSR